MYDIQALEEEWKKYNKNKKRPLYLLLALLLGIILLSLFFMKYKTFHFFTDIDTTVVTKNEHVELNSFVLLDKKISTLLIMPKSKSKNKILKTKPIIDNKNTNDKNIPTLPIVNNIPIIDTVPIGKIILSDKPKSKIKNQLIDKPREKIHLNIIKSSSVSAYADVEKRFMQSYDTDDSLFLAKSYYRKKNYKKAEYWALQTNKVNNSLEESWLIYVKSKAKLGHKNEAIHILTNYAQRSNSSAAWNLLLKLKK